MKKSILLFSMFITAMFVSQAALAEIKIRAGVAKSTYKLGGDYTGATADYNPTNVGLTYAADNGMYVDLAYSGGSGNHDGWATANSPTTICGGTFCTNAAVPNEPFKRSDAALIFGASILSKNTGIASTVYVGLKTGKTTLGAQGTGLAWTDETFTTSGLVFGGGASFPVAGGSAGSVGVNLGLGLMGAKWKDSTGWSIKAKTALGFSLGASYTYPITPSFGVTADYKYNAYGYDFDNFGKSFKVNETISALGASLYVKF